MSLENGRTATRRYFSLEVALIKFIFSRVPKFQCYDFWLRDAGFFYSCTILDYFNARLLRTLIKDVLNIFD